MNYVPSTALSSQIVFLAALPLAAYDDVGVDVHVHMLVDIRAMWTLISTSIWKQTHKIVDIHDHVGVEIYVRMNINANMNVHILDPRPYVQSTR